MFVAKQQKARPHPGPLPQGEGESSPGLPRITSKSKEVRSNSTDSPCARMAMRFSDWRRRRSSPLVEAPVRVIGWQALLVSTGAAPAAMFKPPQIFNGQTAEKSRRLSKI